MNDEKLNLILNEIQSMNKRMNDMKSQMTQGFEQVETKVDGVAEQVAENAEKIVAIKDNQKTIADVIDKMASVQERQEGTIDLLARRSLDQEAEIRRIK